jgi:hypothetical protein
MTAMSLALATEVVPLRIVGLDGRAVEAGVFLRAGAERAEARERLDHKLNDPELVFLPVKLGAKIELVHLAWVAYFACAGRPPEVAAREEVGAQRERVELELAFGELVEGELLYTLPSGHARVSDLLNDPAERFLLLLAERETLFVHRAAIVRARSR